MLAIFCKINSINSIYRVCRWPIGWRRHRRRRLSSSHCHWAVVMPSAKSELFLWKCTFSLILLTLLNIHIAWHRLHIKTILLHVILHPSRCALACKWACVRVCVLFSSLGFLLFFFAFCCRCFWWKEDQFRSTPWNKNVYSVMLPTLHLDNVKLIHFEYEMFRCDWLISCAYVSGWCEHFSFWRLHSPGNGMDMTVFASLATHTQSLGSLQSDQANFLQFSKFFPIAT